MVNTPNTKENSVHNHHHIIFHITKVLP